MEEVITKRMMNYRFKCRILSTPSGSWCFMESENDNVICTAMLYGDGESITDGFYRMVNMFHYPETMKMEFLDDKYRFRINGDHMIAIYCDSSQENFNPNCSDRKLGIMR